ncbi:MAG: histidine kinase, partial [Lachnospiraceae bacterium]|nr:histidine kinase [Lachnospiraceae bacterium]
MVKKKRICALIILMVVLAACILPGTAKEVNAKNISGVKYSDMAVDPTVKGSGYSAVLYDNQNGLPTSETNAVTETAEGFIWIGSYSGLIRYDGNTFERMDSTTGITSVVCLYVDSKNRLWIGTNDNGVAVMENGKYTVYDTSDGLGSSSVRSITEDSKGTIYIASTNGLNTVTEDMVLHRFDEKQINNKYICELRITDQDVIYGETMDGDIFTIENGTLTSFYGAKSLGVGDVNCVLPDPDNPGYVYIGNTESQIYYGMLSGSLHDVKRMSIYPLTYAASIEKYNGKVWVCADNGIGVFDDDGFHILEDIPLNNSIEHMMVDYEGNLWFTSSRQGIMKIVPNQFTDVYDKYGLENAVVNSTCEYNDMLFIGTDTGLTVIDKNKVIDEVVIQCKDTNDRFRFNHNLISLLQGCRIRSIKRDSKNRLWIATYSTRGLLIYDNGMITRFDNENGLPSNKVRTVYEMSDGTVMVACSGGMVRIRDDKVAGSYDNRSGINNLDVLTVTEGFNDDAIIGSDGNGIYVIKGQNIINLGKKDGLHSEVVMRLKRDEERKVIWIITSNSIAYMTEDYKITTIAGFPYSNNFDMYENSHGQMWILSSNGIYVIPTDNLIGNTDINPVFFSMDNGLPCVATANSYSCVDKDGILYIAGTTGVAAVNIEEVSLDIGNIKLNVPYIEADGEFIYPDKNGTFNIPSSSNRLVIYAYIYTYALINPKVTYWLEGFDKDFITKSRKDMEPVVYTNL